MAKRWLLTFLACASMTPAAWARDYETLGELEALTHHYYASNIGLNSMDFVLFTRGEGHLADQKSDKAIAIFQELATRYPQHPIVHLFLGRAYLQFNQLAEAEAALQVARDHFDSTYAARPVFQAYLFGAEALFRQKNALGAERLLRSLPVDVTRLDVKEWEAYYVYLAQLRFNQGDLIAAYSELQTVVDSGLRAEKARSFLADRKEDFAKGFYDAAKKAYFADRAYGTAGTYARQALRLMPGEPAYTALSAQAHEALQDMLLKRFKRALPVLNNSLRNLRYALEINDYRLAWDTWRSMKSNDDIAFILENEYDLYLPKSMVEVLKGVEAELKRKGYAV